MLKIKDNVDLKELEKYGFKYCGNYNRGDCWVRKVNDEVIRGIMVQGDWDNRKIYFEFPYMNIQYPNLKDYIKDLIVAGLVEKVEDIKC